MAESNYEPGDHQNDTKAKVFNALKAAVPYELSSVVSELFAEKKPR